MGSLSGHRVRAGAFVAVLCASAVIGLAQMGGRISARYEHEMQDPVADPPDAGKKAEFALGRLRYRSPLDRGRGYSRWGIDANKGDRIFITLLRRLTRMDVEPTETVIDVDSDQIFDVPFLFAVSVGDWQLSTGHAARLRQYFERGGFMMVDDFHNDSEWAVFMEGMQQIDATAEVVEMADGDAPFHVLYDMTDRVRVPGANVVHGSGIERGGTEPHWRAVLDSRQRVMVAITFNQDIGDGWEFADDPGYPERLSSEAIRLGVNNVVYAITH